MAESHDLDEAILGQPMALFDHVIEHHRDLRDRSADIDEAEKEKIEKHFPPRGHLIVRVGITLLISRYYFRFTIHRRCKNA